MARTGYHLVDVSPWPFMASSGSLGLTTSFVMYLHNWGFQSVIFMGSSVFLLLLTAFRWWGDIIIESTYLGHYTSLVMLNLKGAFWSFIASEVFFFLSFFWAFFYCGIGEMSQQLIGQWPPLGLKTIHPGKVAMLNTAVLVGSGLIVNWAHQCVFAHGLKKGDKFWRNQGLFSLGITILLGVYFTYLQAMEYYMASYTIADSAFGSCFFLLTGFHGAHVIIGTIFLSVCWFRLFLYHFCYQHYHFGMWAAMMYWHFVDAVWIALYIVVYLWGGWGGW